MKASSSHWKKWVFTLIENNEEYLRLVLVLFFSLIFYMDIRPFLCYGSLVAAQKASPKRCAITSGKPPGACQFAEGWGDAGFEAGTAEPQPGALPMRHRIIEKSYMYCMYIQDINRIYPLLHSTILDFMIARQQHLFFIKKTFSDCCFFTIGKANCKDFLLTCKLTKRWRNGTTCTWTA
jgi:hypothetical protein